MELGDIMGRESERQRRKGREKEEIWYEREEGEVSVVEQGWLEKCKCL